jgi:hypothetical protein
VKLAELVNYNYPGLISENWLPIKIKNAISDELENSEYNFSNFLEELHDVLSELKPKRRKEYLASQIKALTFFYNNPLSRGNTEIQQASKELFGYKISRIQDKEIREITTEIRNLEIQIGKTRQEVFNANIIQEENLLKYFKQRVDSSKNVLPEYILDFEDNGFEYKLTKNKPWSAFNSHINTGKSRLTLNTDSSINKLDLKQLSYHEGYGGHHAELSQKDRLLIEGRGEHGLIIIYSPQVFISEAIAEGVNYYFNVVNGSSELKLAWNYNRLIFALQNLATYMYFEDETPIDDIKNILREYYVSEKSITNIINYSTDELYGLYATVYYSAFNFFQEIYINSKDKDQLLKELFTKPCTPLMFR